MVASLLLILVAVGLLVLGLAGGSSLLLTTSIAASLLAALALVVGARRAAASRAAADPSTADASWPHRPPAGVRPPDGPGIPAQHVPQMDGTDDTGWRQPPGSSAPADEAYPGPPAPPFGEPVSDPGPAESDPSFAPPADEPPALRVSPADAALVARLAAEVLVVDGRPRYHLADCGHLLEHDAEPLPVSEAVALGFTPCARCAPDAFLVAGVERR